jgi:hypothetical protein
MRDVMHHMADEETDFLPQAERVLRGRLGELGAQMMRRRARCCWWPPWPWARR